MDSSLSPPFEVSRRSVSSPEFEFWMVGSTPQPDLLTADELFVDGVLLPLHLLSLPRALDTDSLPSSLTTCPDPSPATIITGPANSTPPPPPSASITCTTCTPPSASKRWKDIFKPSEKKIDETKKKERKGTTNGGGVAEQLNINIWPFSRSRSAGNNVVRPRVSTASRKISSAPCSRSNSRGESSKLTGSASRRCAASPGRNSLSGGVHLGRASPVWQLRRPEKVSVKDKANTTRKATGSSGGAAGRVLSLNVNTCIGYRSQVSCRSDDGDAAAAGGGGGGGNGGLFKLRTLFGKKVY